MLETCGRDPAPVFESAGLDVSVWEDPYARVPATRLDAVWREAIRVAAEPCFGLQAARCWHPSQLHALGYAWLVSDTLADAAARLARYFRLITEGAALEIAESGSELRLTIVPSYPVTDVGGTIHERTDAFLAILLGLCRLSTDERFAPRSVHMRRPEPSCVAEFYELFKAPISFGASRDMMVFHSADMHRPLPSANKELAHANEQVVTEYLRRLDATEVAGRVRMRLLDSLSAGEVDEAEMARALNLSRRTLQRRLAEEGTSFKEVLDETRRQVALRYVRNPRVPLKEVSFLLGFSEPSNFTRAFRRWTGKAPSEFRLQGPDA
jgi:AraC-like DNA-binding protein